MHTRLRLISAAVVFTLLCYTLNLYNALYHVSLYNASPDINSPDYSSPGSYSKVDGVRGSRCIQKWITSRSHSAAICSISKDTLRYIDEWTDYHLAIGFEKIYVYDNSDDFELQEWHNNLPDEVREHIKIKHYPGINLQMHAYNDCTQRIQLKKAHSWIAYFDLDEFLVIRDLKKYPHIMDLLDDVPDFVSALPINWVVFGINNQREYEAKPVTYRFQKRKENAIDKHVKLIVRADSVRRVHNPHFVTFNSKLALAADTSGNKIDGPFNEHLTGDVVVLHHYTTKSLEEYVGKCERGTTIPKEKWASKPYCWSDKSRLMKYLRRQEGNVTDSAAWTFLKERVPKYDIY